MNLKTCLLLVASGTLGLLTSCSLKPGAAGTGLAAYQAFDRPARLPDDPGRVQVKVSLRKQRTYVMEGNEVLLSMPVSVGAPGSPTPTGDFHILNKEKRHRASKHGYAYAGDQIKRIRLSNRPAGWSFKGTPMPYWCEFKPSLGFHTGWLKHHPCTDGCIRMHENLAPKFFRLVSVGTPVSIAYSQPEDATHRNIPLPPDSGPLPDYDHSMYVGDGYFSRHKTPAYH